MNFFLLEGNSWRERERVQSSNVYKVCFTNISVSKFDEEGRTKNKPDYLKKEGLVIFIMERDGVWFFCNIKEVL